MANWPQLPDPTMVLAASGPEAIIKRRLKSMQQQVESAGLVCRPMKEAPLFTRILRCRSTTTSLDAR